MGPHWERRKAMQENLGPFAFGQFQNVIYIGVLPLDQSAH